MLTQQKIIEMLSDRNLAEVGRRIKVTRSYLCAVVNGAKVSEEMQKKLSDYLENQCKCAR